MKKIILITMTLCLFLSPTLPQVLHKNSGTSQSIGSVSNGQLINGYKVPYKGKNFKYFSPLDYFIFGRCYLHSDVFQIVINSYKDINRHYPDYTFRLMECSSRNGGKAFPHRTHQNGTSVDFMTPLTKNGKAISRLDHLGIWRYLTKFNTKGQWRLNKKVEIDFEKTALHILALEKQARKKGYKIKKVILETNLKDELMASKYGPQLKTSNIYFVKSLPKNINELHDDHYHIDFVRVQ